MTSPQVVGSTVYLTMAQFSQLREILDEDTGCDSVLAQQVMAKACRFLGIDDSPGLKLNVVVRDLPESIEIPKEICMAAEELPSGVLIYHTLSDHLMVVDTGPKVLKGWNFDKRGRYIESQTEEFQRRALEDLYCAISPGGGQIRTPAQAEKIKRMIALVDQLAIELVGGIPETYEEYC